MRAQTRCYRCGNTEFTVVTPGGNRDGQYAVPVALRFGFDFDWRGAGICRAGDTRLPGHLGRNAFDLEPVSSQYTPVLRNVRRG